MDEGCVGGICMDRIQNYIDLGHLVRIENYMYANYLR